MVFVESPHRSERNSFHQPEPGRDSEPLNEGGLRAPAHYSTLRKIWWWFDFLILVKLARLRFIGILVAIGAVIVYWETLHAYYDKWTRPILGQEQAVRVPRVDVLAQLAQELMGLG